MSYARTALFELECIRFPSNFWEDIYLNVRILLLKPFITYCFPSFTVGEKDELVIIIIIFKGENRIRSWLLNL